MRQLALNFAFRKDAKSYIRPVYSIDDDGDSTENELTGLKPLQALDPEANHETHRLDLVVVI